MVLFSAFDWIFFSSFQHLSTSCFTTAVKMRFFGVPTAVLALAGVVQSAALQPRDLLQDLQDQAIAALKEAEANGTVGKRSSCSVFNAPARKNW